MRAYWVVYLVFVVCYKIATLIYLRMNIGYSFNWMDVLYVVFFIGLFGYSLNRRVLTKKIWRFIFAISIILYLNTWIVMPSYYFFGSKIAMYSIFYMMIFNVPLLPLLYALYSYAWKSEALWAEMGSGNGVGS